MQCRNCGDPVDPRRVELGYDYCLKDECQRECLERVRLAAIGINKAADYYVRAEEVLPPSGPEMAPGDGDDATVADAAPRSTTTKKAETRPKTTLERLRGLDAELDQALERSFERFRSGELTAREMDRERDRLVEAFNRQVMSENIRYRSMLRRRSDARRSG